MARQGRGARFRLSDEPVGMLSAAALGGDTVLYVTWNDAIPEQDTLALMACGSVEGIKVGKLLNEGRVLSEVQRGIFYSTVRTWAVATPVYTATLIDRWDDQAGATTTGGEDEK